jgi:hypothetical protein
LISKAEAVNQEALLLTRQRFDGFIGFDERMVSLMSMWPLYGLTAKDTLSGYAGFELGICLLLFIMEKMLRYEVCTYEDARDFLESILPMFADQPIAPGQAETVVQKLLNELSNYGKPFLYNYRSPDGTTRQVKFRLLEQKPYSLPGRDTIELRLTQEALDILFKSREIYRDLRFSVMQFYLEQQIRLGTFDGALDTVRQLGVAVGVMEHDLELLRTEIRRNVVEAMAKSGYRRIYGRIIDQMNREGEIFNNLIRLVRESRRNAEDSAMSGYDERLLNVQRLEQELYGVSHRHLALLNLHLDLNFLAEDALLASLRSTLAVRFHLERELLAEVLRQNPPGEVVVKVGTLPLLMPHCPRIFDLSSFLGPQILLSRNRERPPEDDLSDTDLEAERAQEQFEQQRQERTLELLQRIFKMILTPLLKTSEACLSQIAFDIWNDGWPRYEVEAFLYMMLILHHATKIEARLPWDFVPSDVDILELALYRLLQGNKELAGIGTVRVTAGDGEIDLPHGMKVNNLVFYGGQ